jgi:hypothetical protein
MEHAGNTSPIDADGYIQVLANLLSDTTTLRKLQTRLAAVAAADGHHVASSTPARPGGIPDLDAVGFMATRPASRASAWGSGVRPIGGQTGKQLRRELQQVTKAAQRHAASGGDSNVAHTASQGEARLLSGRLPPAASSSHPFPPPPGILPPYRDTRPMQCCCCRRSKQSSLVSPSGIFSAHLPPRPFPPSRSSPTHRYDGCPCPGCFSPISPQAGPHLWRPSDPRPGQPARGAARAGRH